MSKSYLAFLDTRKVKVLSLPETIKEKSTFRAKALRRELVVTVDKSNIKSTLTSCTLQNLTPFWNK